MTEAEQAHAKLRAALVATTDAIGRAIDALGEADTSLGDAWRLMGKDRADACTHEWSHVGERVVINVGRQFSRRCAGCGAETGWVKESDLAAAPMRRADAIPAKEIDNTSMWARRSLPSTVGVADRLGAASLYAGRNDTAGN